MPNEICKRIKIGLIRAGLRQADIARELGMAPAHISMVIAGKVKSRRVMAHLEERLGISLQPEDDGGGTGFQDPEDPLADHAEFLETVR